MNQQPTRTGQTGNWPEQLAQYLDQFEQAWQSGNAPEIDQFLAGLEDQWKNWDQTTRSKLLEELIKLDLEFRWRQLHQAGGITADMAEQDTLVEGADESKRWFLEDYVRQHPQLGSSGKLPLELVLEEYRVRQLWGDAPTHQEYVKRFPDHGQALPERLAQVDSDLPAPADTESSQQTASATIPAEPLASGRFGDYELLGEIARGGMGVVYRARQISLDRTVAVKMILSGQLASEEDVRRFRTEAESAARLQHPHIVTIHEVGELKGQHYFSMDFIEGESLSDRVVGGPLAAEEAAELVSKVSAAIDYAHQQGILHRDLKPQNILIDSSQQPQITDFGLAKRIEGRSDLTGTGQILGTPSYMPPEQAGSDPSAVGPASDIYSLGAILYELVTGRPPFQAQTPLDTLMQVLSEEPVAPRLLNASVPRDLETIILKCLQKQPSKRYTSAAALSEELGRYQEGKPIAARPVGAWERGWRWCRRKPAVAGMWALAAVLLLTLSIGGPLVAIKQSELRSQADMERQKAVTAGQAEAKQRKEAEIALKTAERNAYNSDMLLAQRDWEDTNIGHLRELLDRYRHRTDLKGFEWGYWNRLINSELFKIKGNPEGVNSVSFSPDGKRIVGGGSDNVIKVWDAETGQEVLSLKGHTGIVKSVSFSPDGKRIVSGGSGAYPKPGEIKVWDAATGEEMLTLKGHSNAVNSVAFSPDGKRIVSGGNDETVKVWDSETGQELVTLKGHPNYVFSVAFSPDGKRIVSGGNDETVKVWDAETGAEIRTLKGHTDWVSNVAFSPDGKRILSSSDDLTVKVWDAVTGQELRTLKGYSKNAGSVSFSPDGTRIISSSIDNMIKVWDAESGREIMALRGHNTMTLSAEFSPDGKRIVSSGDGENVVMVWDAENSQQTLTLKQADSISAVSFSPDGKRIVSGGENGVKVWDAETGQETLTLKGISYLLAFSPDGKLIVSFSSAGTLKVWDAETGAENCTLEGHTGIVKSVSFSPDGKRIVSGERSPFGEPAVIKGWDAETGQLEITFKGHSDKVWSVAFSPDGTRIVSGSFDKTVKVWDADTGQETLSLKGHTNYVLSVAFSPDGKRIVSGSSDRTLKVWDAETGAEILTLKGHTRNVNSVSFSPDGKRIVSGSNDGTVKFWDAATGQEVLTLEGHTGIVKSVSFSLDGKRIVSSSSDGTVKVWDARSKRQE